jgi:hypothetical protein
MVIHSRSRQVDDDAQILEHLVKGLKLGRHAFFYVTGEGDIMPNGVEEASGHVIDERGRVFAFWLGCDDRRKVPIFTEWEEVQPESSWLESSEYRHARECVGLP